METLTQKSVVMQPPPLRAVVEVVEGRLRVCPIAQSDEEAAAIIKAVTEAHAE